MVMDYLHIGISGKAIVSELDHTYLNDTLHVQTTTAEYLALWIFNRLDSVIPGLWSVTVKETESSSATYSPYDV